MAAICLDLNVVSSCRLFKYFMSTSPCNNPTTILDMDFSTKNISPILWRHHSHFHQLDFVPMSNSVKNNLVYIFSHNGAHYTHTSHALLCKGKRNRPLYKNTVFVLVLREAVQFSKIYNSNGWAIFKPQCVFVNFDIKGLNCKFCLNFSIIFRIYTFLTIGINNKCFSDNIRYISQNTRSNRG